LKLGIEQTTGARVWRGERKGGDAQGTVKWFNPNPGFICLKPTLVEKESFARKKKREGRK